MDRKVDTLEKLGSCRSVEERQREYHRARARIFGGEGASAYIQQPQQLGVPPGAQPVYGTAGGLPASPMHSPFPVSPPRPGEVALG